MRASDAMLGESREVEDARERGRFANWLKSMPWASAAERAHDGYAADAFHALLDAKRPPAPGAERAAWRGLVWATWRCFVGLQAQRTRLDLTAA